MALIGGDPIVLVITYRSFYVADFFIEHVS